MSVAAFKESKSLVFTRVESIDLLRGVVMIIMALDHVRDYFHANAFLFNPLDLEKTSVALFATRWITHFCAPVFVFLAGTSAFLVGQRKGKKELSAFLLTRGIWLVVLEFTVINFAWFFNFTFDNIALTVIWALGMGMVILALTIHLPFRLILLLGLLLVAGHNALDTFHVEGSLSYLWKILHESSLDNLGYFNVFIGYPLLPWAGIMMLGYCFGSLYVPSVDPVFRKKRLYLMGFTAVIVFFIIRAINVYGDPVPWSIQPNASRTFLSFINVNKYPPSLLYALVTLGPAMLFLAISEKYSGKIVSTVTALGRVPMFYYIIHIYVIHILALVAALATGFKASDMVFHVWVSDSPNLKGYGFSLTVTYVIWILLVLALMPLCLWYDRYKRNHREKRWLSYL